MSAAAAGRRDALFRDAERLWPVMGILNVTPDSFSDGGRFEADSAGRGDALAAEGAAVIDIGGESTRPGFIPVSAEEEWRRIAPAIEVLADRLSIPLSVDTTKAVVARRALAAGATIVNDQWGLQGDPAMAEAVAAQGAGAVLMHNRLGIDPTLDIGDDMLRFFERSLAIADAAGLHRGRIALDPGVGFGKSPGQQLDAIRAVGRLRAAFGLPVLVGLSKKRFLGALTGAPVHGRGVETVAANLAAAAAGASMFRVHDVAAHRAALAVFGAIRRAGVAG